MKLRKLKGIAHDLAHHLGLEIWFGGLKNLKNQDTHILKRKNAFDRLCVEFFKERLPKTFDFNTIEDIHIQLTRTASTLTISILVKVKGKEFTYQMKSMLG